MPTTQPRGAVALITNSRGEYLLHLRDDIDGIAWPAHWSLLGGGCDAGALPLTEGQRLDWVAPRLLDSLAIPPFARRVLSDHRAGGN